MKTWKTILIDDEPLACYELKRLLASIPETEVVAEASSVEDARKKIEAYSPDLLFLDIDLGSGTGFDLLEIVPMKFQVIFVTAFDSYAIRAFEVNALDYLLKPVHPDRLKAAVARLNEKQRPQNDVQLKYDDKILIQTGRASHLVDVSNILCIEANGDYTNIYNRNGLKGIMHRSINLWIRSLPADKFIQTHRSYVVNVDYIETINRRSSDLKEILVSGIDFKIPVSRRKYSEFKKKFR